MDKRWECHMWRQRGKNGFMNIWKKGAEETGCCSKVRRKPCATVSYVNETRLRRQNLISTHQVDISVRVRKKPSA